MRARFIGGGGLSRLAAALALPALLLLTALGGAGCQPIHAGAEATVWLAALQGNALKADSLGALGDKLDLDDYLHAPTLAVVPGGRVWLQVWKLRFSGSLWAMSDSGAADLAAGTIDFGDRTFTGLVSSDLDLMLMTTNVEFVLLAGLPPARLYLGVGTGVSLIDSQYTLREVLAPATAEKLSILDPYPGVGAFCEVTPLAPLTLRASLYGYFDVTGLDGHVIEGRLGARWNFAGAGPAKFGLGIDYLFWSVHAESGGEELDFFAHGAALYLSAAF